MACPITYGGHNYHVVIESCEKVLEFTWDAVGNIFQISHLTVTVTVMLLASAAFPVCPYFPLLTCCHFPDNQLKHSL